MQLTLREALTLAEPLRQARVVAGEGGLDNVVGSVNVMPTPRQICPWRILSTNRSAFSIDSPSTTESITVSLPVRGACSPETLALYRAGP